MTTFLFIYSDPFSAYKTLVPDSVQQAAVGAVGGAVIGKGLGMVARYAPQLPGAFGRFFGTEVSAVPGKIKSLFASPEGASTAAQLEQRGLSKLALPRTSSLGSTSTTAELLQMGAIPGREGVVLTQPHVTFNDIWQLSDNAGVEFVLTREDGQFVLRSGSPTSAPIPAGVRPIVHTHPVDMDGINSLLPSPADINVLNKYWAENPSIARPVSQIITGPNETTVFRATGLDPWGK